MKSSALSARSPLAIAIRVLAVLLFLAAIFSLCASESWAAEAAERGQLPKDFRGSGNYYSWIKVAACWLLFLLWGQDDRLGQH